VTVPADAAVPARSYDLRFDRAYQAPPPPPLPRPYVPDLVPVTWGGLVLQADEDRDSSRWFTAIVENVDGWYASPPLDGKNADRELSDGSVWGPKLLRAREVTLRGAAAGPRARLMSWRDQLARRAVSREPLDLIIGDRELGTSLLAMVRGDTDSFRHAFLGGGTAFRWEVTLTAADPRLYDMAWQQVTLTTETAAESGRPYARLYAHPREAHPGPLNGWQYEEPYPPGAAAYMRNDGDADAPVFAAWDGDLTASRLTDETLSVLLAPVGTGIRIDVDTESLTATAPGGEPRAAWVLPGSRGMVIPPMTTARWHLYAQGSGTVTLSWRSAWA